MDSNAQQTVQDFLRQSLLESGDQRALADDDSLFISSRLDSLAMTRLVLFLEERFDVDFGKLNFEVEMIDSLHAIGELLAATAARRTA